MTCEQVQDGGHSGRCRASRGVRGHLDDEGRGSQQHVVLRVSELAIAFATEDWTRAAASREYLP
jgi:hypothetical protein